MSVSWDFFILILGCLCVSIATSVILAIIQLIWFRRVNQRLKALEDKQNN